MPHLLHLLDTKTLLLITLVWAIAAYLIIPKLWLRHFRRHPFFTQPARLTETGDGHPGDPINIGLVGSESEIVRAMTKAGWYPADKITLASSVRIAADTVLRRPDDDAPVSNLFLFGRKQDLAFEQPLKGGPGKRHHVRFWLWDQLYEGRQGWFGAATYDTSVGLSHTTGQVTHHIAPDVDAERDRLVSELQQAGVAQSVAMARRLPRRCSRAITAAAIPGTPMDASPWSRSDRSEVTDSAPFVRSPVWESTACRTRARTPRGRMLSPRPEPPLSCIHLVLLRALREACVEAGRGAAPAGLVATRHPGGTGAPPGTTRSPCQELADARRRV